MNNKTAAEFPLPFYLFCPALRICLLELQHFVRRLWGLAIEKAVFEHVHFFIGMLNLPKAPFFRNGIRRPLKDIHLAPFTGDGMVSHIRDGLGFFEFKLFVEMYAFSGFGIIRRHRIDFEDELYLDLTWKRRPGIFQASSFYIHNFKYSSQ